MFANHLRGTNQPNIWVRVCLQAGPWCVITEWHVSLAELADSREVGAALDRLERAAGLDARAAASSGKTDTDRSRDGRPLDRKASRRDGGGGGGVEFDRRAAFERNLRRTLNVSASNEVCAVCARAEAN